MIRIEQARVSKIKEDYLGKIEKKQRRHSNVLCKYFIDELKKIVLLKPDKLREYNNEFEDRYNAEIGARKDSETYLEFKKYMKSQYDEFIKTNGYWLSLLLNVNVCPYCNRQYIFTAEKVTRPQFDHFYPKSTYPLLALSLYNLVPSCSVCNQIKKENVIDYHPYIEGFDDKVKFEINYLAHLLKNEPLKISFTNTNTNIDILKLEEIYQGHIDYVQEILDKSYAYSEGYYNALNTSYAEKLGLTSEYIDRLIWGVYLDKDSHEKRPLSKLTSDILEQLNIK